MTKVGNCVREFEKVTWEENYNIQRLKNGAQASIPACTRGEVIANVLPCVVSIDYLSGLVLNWRFFNDNCIQLLCQTSVSPLRLGKTGWNIGHTHALLWLFIYYYNFFLSTCGVIISFFFSCLLASFLSFICACLLSSFLFACLIASFLSSILLSSTTITREWLEYSPCFSTKQFLIPPRRSTSTWCLHKLKWTHAELFQQFAAAARFVRRHFQIMCACTQVVSFRDHKLRHSV